ncbi:hypothetical protein ARMSODRAFT_948995 [Armillaria solidipes]|uniref:Uncharacterized protein n=1 Tax=Armillaria solidipes TaxID=1076256 RepID=A0A2H3C5D6_9AGAR|nr:hypothetical protein ARMSODRAFT_948995 [Armillaria solidipes]
MTVPSLEEKKQIYARQLAEYTLRQWSTLRKRQEESARKRRSPPLPKQRSPSADITPTQETGIRQSRWSRRNHGILHVDFAKLSLDDDRGRV